MGLFHLSMICLTLLLLRIPVNSAVSCSSGDTFGIVKNGKTCSQLISSTNYECYDATMETSCCASCNAIATGISGCQYGDKVANCIVVLCPFYTDPSECCSTCLTTTTTTTSTTTTTTTTTTTPAENITTGSTSQESSRLPISAGVIAAVIAGSIVVAVLIAVFMIVMFKTSKKKRSVVISSNAHKNIKDNTTDENSDCATITRKTGKGQLNPANSVPYENGGIVRKKNSLPPLELTASRLPPLPNVISSNPPLMTAKTKPDS